LRLLAERSTPGLLTRVTVVEGDLRRPDLALPEPCERPGAEGALFLKGGLIQRRWLLWWSCSLFLALATERIHPMKIVMTVLLTSLLGPSAWAASPPWGNHLDPGAVAADKLLHLSGNRALFQIQSGGDDIATATVIPGLPFNDAGYTCGFANDYDVACPYSGSISPDVVYKYTPASNTNVDVDLCASLYDTKVYVFDGSSANVVACNDDADCAVLYRSKLTNVPLTAGHDYYIVVDGYGGDCGDYSLAVSEPVSCPGLVTCMSYDQPENEPDCFDGFIDTFDGGCNSIPPVFSPVFCGTICGTTGNYVYDGGQYRDTDWYEITVGPGNFTYSGVMNGYDLQLYLVSTPCETATILDQALATSCSPATINFAGPGTFYLWAGLTVYEGVPCGTPYRLDITGPGIGSCQATPAARSTWGGLKVLYR
jgi:hypothetical protein